MLNVDPEKKRVALGLKASYFEDEDEDMPDADLEEPIDEMGDVIETDSEPPENDPMQVDSFAPTPT